MSQFRIRVQVDPRQAVDSNKVVRRALKETEKEAKKVESSLKKAFKTFGALFLAKQAIHLADSYTALQNKIKVLIGSNDDLENVTRRLFDVANSTRISIEDTGKVYQRVALAGQSLGLSQDRVIRITGTLNRAMILSGATTQEASNALVQFSQGLASGTLRGDELRSVLEQGVVLTQIFAKHLGKSTAQIKLMGAEGKLTSDVLIEALEKNEKVLKDRIAKTAFTIGQGFIRAMNGVKQFLGELNKASGIGRAISYALRLIGGALSLVADNMNIVKPLVIAVASAFAVDFATAVGVKAWGAVVKLNVAIISGLKKTLGRLIVSAALLAGEFAGAMVSAVRASAKAFRGFNAVLRANPFVLIAAAVIALVAVIIKFRKEIWKGISAVLEFLGIDPKAFAQAMIKALRDIADAAKAAWDATKKFGSFLTKFSPAAGMRDLVDKQLEAVRGSKELNARYKELTKGVEFYAKNLSKADKEAVAAQTERGKLILENLRALDRLGKSNRDAKRAQDRDYLSLALATPALDKIRREAELLKLTNEEREFQIFLLKAEKAARASAKKSGDKEFGGFTLGTIGEFRKAFDAKQKILKQTELQRDAARRSADERKRLIGVIRNLRDSVTPLVAAQASLRDVEKDLNKAARKGLVSRKESLALLSVEKDKRKDALDPLGAFNKSIRDEIRLLGVSSDLRGAESEILQTEIELREKLGKKLFDESGAAQQIAEGIQARNEARKAAEALAQIELRSQEILIDLTGNTDEYKLQVKALNLLLSNGKISFAQWSAGVLNAGQALEDSRPSFDKFIEGLNEQIRLTGISAEQKRVEQFLIDAEIANGQRLSEAQRRQLLDKTALLFAQEEEQKRLQELSKETKFKLGDLGRVGANAFSRMSDEVAKMTVMLAQGKFSADKLRESFSRMAASMLSDLTRLIIKKALFSAISGFGGSPDLAKALTGVTQGFASGGSFMVGGSGGTDSQLVAFRASPSERVTIETPQQRQQADAGPSTPQDIQVNNFIDRDSLIDATINSPEGMRAILNVVSANRKRFNAGG